MQPPYAHQINAFTEFCIFLCVISDIFVSFEAFVGVTEIVPRLDGTTYPLRELVWVKIFVGVRDRY